MPPGAGQPQLSAGNALRCCGIRHATVCPELRLTCRCQLQPCARRCPAPPQVVVQAGFESNQSQGGDSRCQTARIAFEDLCEGKAKEAVFMSRIEQFSQLVAQCAFQRGLATVFSQLLQHDESSCEVYIMVGGCCGAGEGRKAGCLEGC